MYNRLGGNVKRRVRVLKDFIGADGMPDVDDDDYSERDQDIIEQLIKSSKLSATERPQAVDLTKTNRKGQQGKWKKPGTPTVKFFQRWCESNGNPVDLDALHGISTHDDVEDSDLIAKKRAKGTIVVGDEDDLAPKMAVSRGGKLKRVAKGRRIRSKQLDRAGHSARSKPMGSAAGRASLKSVGRTGGITAPLPVVSGIGNQIVGVTEDGQPIIDEVRENVDQITERDIRQDAADHTAMVERRQKNRKKPAHAGRTSVYGDDRAGKSVADDAAYVERHNKERAARFEKGKAAAARMRDDVKRRVKSEQFDIHDGRDVTEDRRKVIGRRRGGAGSGTMHFRDGQLDRRALVRKAAGGSGKAADIHEGDAEDVSSDGSEGSGGSEEYFSGDDDE